MYYVCVLVYVCVCITHKDGELGIRVRESKVLSIYSGHEQARVYRSIKGLMLLILEILF